VIDHTAEFQPGNLIVSEHVYPEAEKVVLVHDNLDTHKLASLYEAFPPEEARRLSDRLGVYYTPKHGSWLDMAELNSAFTSGNASTVAYPTEKWSRPKSLPGNTTATLPAAA